MRSLTSLGGYQVKPYSHDLNENFYFTNFWISIEETAVNIEALSCPTMSGRIWIKRWRKKKEKQRKAWRENITYEEVHHIYWVLGGRPTGPVCTKVHLPLHSPSPLWGFFYKVRLSCCNFFIVPSYFLCPLPFYP